MILFSRFRRTRKIWPKRPNAEGFGGGSLAEWRGTQGYFEKLNKVYLGWHFGLKNGGEGTFSEKKFFVGGIFWGTFFLPK